MEFLRRHLFFILCGVASAAGIGLAITGLGAMPDVMVEMEKAEKVYRDLTSLQSKPVNQAVIDAETERGDRTLDDSERILDKAKEMYAYEPLVEGALPDGSADKLLLFRDRYLEAMSQLMESLKYGSPATQAEISATADKIEREAERGRGFNVDPGAPTTPQVPEGPHQSASGVLLYAGVKSNAAARAHIAKAQGIYCYAQPLVIKVGRGGARIEGPTTSLAYNTYMKDIETLEPPDLEDVWWSQIEYWIQKDVINAIVAVNEEAAATAKAREGDRWVGIMPVKDVISIRLSDGFIQDDDDEFVGARAGGHKEALPCGTKNTVFSASMSNASYEVLQFTVKLVMDQRDILRLVDRITKDKFHTLLRMAYRVVPPSRAMLGKIYGSEPTVNVVLDFETILLPGKFRPLMPDKVCEDFGIDCPKRDDEGQDD